MPLIGESQMYDYISIRLKRNDGNADDAEMEKKDHAVLLRTIQPNLEKQKQDNQVEAERAVSTIFSLVEDKYKLTELRVEYMTLRDNWNKDSTGREFQKRDGLKTRINSLL